MTSGTMINAEKRERYITTLITLLHQYWNGTIEELIERIRAADQNQTETNARADDD